MAVHTLKGNATIAGATIGTIGLVRSISISQSQATYDYTANDTATGRTYLGTWADGTMTVSGIFDADAADHVQLEAYAANATLDTITITFWTGLVTDASWAASCAMTGFSIEGDYEGGWTFTAEFQKSGDATWTQKADA